MEDVYALLAALRGRYNQREIAEALGVTTRTLRRWEAKETEPPQFLADALHKLLTANPEPDVPPGKRAFKRRGNWTREQLLLTFHFYCQTPFGQFHSKNKKVIDLAQLIGRSPGAVAMKCVNFASLDPAIRDSGRSGLSNASALDREVWDEFHSNWERLVEECEALHTHLSRDRDDQASSHIEAELTIADFTGEVRTALVKQRLKQAFFRRSVLSSYGEKCCISGVGDKHFLVASHIVAWKDDASIRLHPGNGLCLSVIHDRAFDKHLFSLTNDHRVLLSEQLRRTKDAFLRQVFWPIEDTQITLPEKFVPEMSFVERHRQIMLSGA